MRATWWRHQGVATADIASLLGHKDSRMVERVYGRIDAHSLCRALQRRLRASETAEAPPTPTNAGSAFCSKRPLNREKPDTPRSAGTLLFSVFMVSEDGIEPPTRGFSILCSTN
jgi:hypothetical protein